MKNSLSPEEKKILEIWVWIICQGKTPEEIRMLKPEVIISEWFEKSHASMLKILANKKEASRYIRGLYF